MTICWMGWLLRRHLATFALPFSYLARLFRQRYGEGRNDRLSPAERIAYCAVRTRNTLGEDQ